MAKAATKLGVSTPSISEVIASLEHALGVRLLDRTSKGVIATSYGEALLARGKAAFDELRQGIRDIEFIADPDAGELRIGCPESIAAGFLLLVLQRFSKEHPRVRFHVVPVHQPTVEFPELQERKIDLVLARLAKNPVEGRLTEELNADRQRLQATRQEQGENVYEVRVVYTNRREAVWLFSVSDLLPRSVHRLDGAADLEARQTLRHIVVDPHFDGDPFVLEAPPGYELRHEPAP